MNQTYFKASLVQDKDGTNSVWFDEWHVIHETKCFVFCVPARWYSHAGNSFFDLKRLEGDGESNIQLAKRFSVRVKRVHKQNSRFAFASKELAFNRLKFVKHYHLSHLRHQLRCVEQFVKDAHGKSYAEYEQDRLNEALPLVFVSGPAPWERPND